MASSAVGAATTSSQRLLGDSRALGVLFGDSQVTRFSYIEYQALMLCLAGGMVLSLLAVEITLTRFQVLPLLFPGMFSVRERRFYCFSWDISDGALGKKIRAQAKMLIRMTLCVVLSYLWQHCVLATSQHVGTEFPVEECAEEHDCFASELHFLTLFNRQHTAIDCKGPPNDFESRVVVSCIQFVTPSATTWLMHLAIAHSVTQLNFKSFEVMVWITGNSRRARLCVGFMIFMSFFAFLVLFFVGAMSEFVNSWLSFVMSMSIPVFLHTVWKSGLALEKLWLIEANKVQTSIEEHFNSAFSDIEQQAANNAVANNEQEDTGDDDNGGLDSGTDEVKKWRPSVVKQLPWKLLKNKTLGLGKKDPQGRSQIPGGDELDSGGEEGTPPRRISGRSPPPPLTSVEDSTS